MTIRKQYTREFKEEAVRLWQSTELSARDVERDLNITPGLLYKWKKKFQEEGDAAFPGQGHPSSVEAENQRLRREMEILRQERDILKKAVAIFSQPQQ